MLKLNSHQRRCFKCLGLKNLYKLGQTDSYSLKDTGGVLVSCPACDGKGWVARPADGVPVNPVPVIPDAAEVAETAKPAPKKKKKSKATPSIPDKKKKSKKVKLSKDV